MANPYSPLLPPEPSAFSDIMPAASAAVIGPQYCAPHQVDLTIERKVMTLRDKSFTVTDVDGNLVFNVKATVMKIRSRLVLSDAAGNPIATLKAKRLSIHHQWRIFRGESIDSNDLIATVKRSFIFQPKTKLNVYIANNTKEEVCDFKLKESLLKLSAKIYAGESDVVVAEMKKRHTAGSIVLGKDTYTVKVLPNIDHAFIVALVVILHELNNEFLDEDD